jgi:ankyrin repeat protein
VWHSRPSLARTDPDKLLPFLNQESSRASSKGRTALMVSCMSATAGAASSIARLIKLKADVDMVDSFGYNALLYACDIANQRFPNQKIVSHLLAADADVDHANEITKETPLMMATRRGHTRVSKMLLDANAEVHAQVRPLQQPRPVVRPCMRPFITHAARSLTRMPRPRAARRPSSTRAAPRRTHVSRQSRHQPLRSEWHGSSALCFGTHKPHHPRASAGTRLLLQRKASVDHTNDAGQNALHIAATHGNDDVIVQLVRAHGSNPGGVPLIG